jgi:hypothetical protein
MATPAKEDSSVLEQTTADLVHLVRKFRWMGMEDEAMRVQAALARCLALHDLSPSLGIYLEQQKSSVKASSTERDSAGATPGNV